MENTAPSSWRRYLKPPKRKWGDTRTTHAKWRNSLSVSACCLRTGERNGLRERSTWLGRLRGVTAQLQMWPQSSSPTDHHSTIHHHTQQHHFGPTEYIPAIRLPIQYTSLLTIAFFNSAPSSTTSRVKNINASHIEVLSPKSLNFTMPLSLSSRLSGLMSLWITLLLYRKDKPSKQQLNTTLNSSSFYRLSFISYPPNEP